MACQRSGADTATMAAIDIDPLALDQCVQHLRHCPAVLGSAFDVSTLRQLSSRSWGLVITNPPYVRYQSQKQATQEGLIVPSAAEVRQGLMAALDEMPALDAEDRALFRRMVSGYSGLADLAVPAWFLCAALVRQGGTLAMVVPESWLSRDYALIVRYLLSRWFKIVFLVEDADAVWFSDASVKTTLLIAQRIERRVSAFDWGRDEGFLRMRLSGSAAGEAGLTENLFTGRSVSDSCFAAQAHSWLREIADVRTPSVEAQWLSLADSAQNLLRACSDQKWLGLLENASAATVLPERAGFTLPHELALWLGSRSVHADLTTLEGLGARVGQGLRTGANDFFYADALHETESETFLAPSRRLGLDRVAVPSGCLLPVLRRQSELPSGYGVNAEALFGRVLSLQKWALPEDLDGISSKLLDGAYTGYKPMPEGLATLVRAGGSAEFGEPGERKRVWELSAVMPNVRHRDGITRFWYMLPDFAPRHRPDLLMARVNHGSPKAFLNESRAALVDANFSTVWCESGVLIDVYACLAVMNSTWFQAALELVASVMGWGALKVEASHLRQVPVPRMDERLRAALSSLGAELAEVKDGTACAVLERIDVLMSEALLDELPAQEKLMNLKNINFACLSRRSRKG